MDQAAFSEVVALLQRNEGEERRVQDAEGDARRLLLLARDAKLRDQLVQAQGVRRITLLAKSSSSLAVQRNFTGVLGCLAHSERGRLSASSCSGAAALLAFSVQNECQLQIDNLSGLAVLLRMIDVADGSGGDGELAVLAAATLWNMCKAPVLLLKLETLHALLKDKLLRMLSRVLLVPVEPFQLALTLTGERGAAVLLDFEGDNLNILLTSTISATLSFVLAIENYTGRSRTLADQYRPRSGGSNRIKSAGAGKRNTAGISVAHYDETGALASRTCALCHKAIRMNSSSTSPSSSKKYLLCAREGCGQTYHVSCSRWANLNEEDRHPEHFHCDSCRKSASLYYWDFIAENPREHMKLLTQTMFDAVRITRFDPQVAEINEEGECVMLFDNTHTIVGVGELKYRISASSRDPETIIVLLTHILFDSYRAMQQQARHHSAKTTTNAPREMSKWPLSYARQDSSTAAPLTRGKRNKAKPSIPELAPAATMMPLVPGNAYFWPKEYSLEIRALRYTEFTLDKLEAAALYEFKGGVDREPIDDDTSVLLSSSVYAIGAPIETRETIVVQDSGIWSVLMPRKATCMKLLTEQIGRLRACQSATAELSQDLRPKLVAKARHRSKTSSGSCAKPHFPGKRLQRVAVETVL